MTVAGLWSLLRRRGLVQDLGGAEARDFLEGKRVAIDISAWTVQGSTLEAALGTTRCRHFLAVSFWRLSRCLRLGCFPLAVLEGIAPARSGGDARLTAISSVTSSSWGSCLPPWVVRQCVRPAKPREAVLSSAMLAWWTPSRVRTVTCSRLARAVAC